MEESTSMGESSSASSATAPAATGVASSSQEAKTEAEESTAEEKTTTTAPASAAAAAATTAPTLNVRPTAAAASSSKRPLITHSKDGKLLSEKKLRRLEKNRLSARECRRRKREATENLERQINILEGENLSLRLQLQIGEEAEESMLREQSKLTQDIDALLKSGASEAEIYATLEEFKEKYADYGKSRRSAIEFHLRNVERLLMPTQTTSVVMTAIQGGGDHPATMAPDSRETPPVDVNRSSEAIFSAVSPASTASASGESAQSAENFVLPAAAAAAAAGVAAMDPTPMALNSSNLNPKALFHYLVNHLEVTPQQAAALKDSRLVAREMDGCLEMALALLTELRERLAQTGEDLETEFNNVRNILTPTQAAKFLIWVANNKACMHMLEELWERVYPAEQQTPSGDMSGAGEPDFESPS